MTLFLVGAALCGYAILLTWSARAGRFATQPIDWAEALFVSLVTLIVIVGWVGVALASLERFSLTNLGLVLLAAAVVLWLPRRTFWRPRFLGVGRAEIALAGLLIACGVMYFRPHEYVLGSADAGGYMNIAATVERTGRLIVHDEWTRFLSDYSAVTLRQQPAQWLTRQLQFVGWYIDDADPSRVIPQFFPLHPVLIAVGVGVSGVYGGLLVTPLWGVLCIAAVYFLGRRLFGPSVGLLAAAALAVTPTHIFFARYPTAEPLTLLLVFTGLLAYQHLRDEAQAPAVWGVLAGAALGAAFLTRIDMPVVAILVGLALLFERARGRWHRGWTMFAAVFGLFLLHTLLHAVLFAWPYVWNTYGSVARAFTQTTASLVVAGLGGLTLAVSGVVVWRRRSRWMDSRAWQFLNSNRFRWLLIVCVVALSAYAYFLRPILEPTRYAVSWPSGNQFPILDGQNWVRLGWYLTPLGLLLATLGVAAILRRESLGRTGLFLAVGVLTTIQYVYNIFNTPYHIYAMRRYVPIVIPMLMIYAAVAVVTLFQSQSGRPTRAIGGLLALALIGGMLYQSRFVLPQRDFQGALEQLTALNERLKPGAILVISEPAESFFADTLGTPLRFLFGHDIATIRKDDASVAPFLARLLTRAQAQDRPVQLIAVDAVAPAVRETVALQPVEMFPVTLRMLMNTFDDYPSLIQTAYYGIEIYDVAAPTEAQPADVNDSQIDIGALDSAFIRSGFYGKEPLAGAVSARWTAGDARLDAPLPASPSIEISVRAMIFRPARLPAAAVTVWLSDVQIGQFTPTESWQTYTFRAAVDPSKPLAEVRFETETFNPARLGVNADTRDLGFLIDWLEIVPAS
jgi:4-amino-4-deoxy-L-arabinose transferase-like glycosyltransferase